MAQKLFEDSLGVLTQPASVVQLDGARITLGGQQYNFDTVQESLPSLTSTTLYFVYAVLFSGSPALRISTNVNSVGPAGFNSWKLVGAFYSNGLSSVGFGSFVNIEGRPETELIPFTAIIKGVTSDPTEGGSVVKESWFTRDGKDTIVKFSYTQATGGTAGSGQYYVPPPENLTIDSSVETTVSEQASRVRGSCAIASNGNERHGPALIDVDNGGVQLYTGNETNVLNLWSSSVTSLANDNLDVSFIIRIPITEWSNTPLKDL